MWMDNFDQFYPDEESMTLKMVMKKRRVSFTAMRQANVNMILVIGGHDGNDQIDNTEYFNR